MSDTLRQFIVESGLHQTELAAETGLTQGAISHFLLGRRGLSLDIAQWLCDYFQLELRRRSEAPTPRGRKK